jgi:hypothetical protein
VTHDKLLFVAQFLRSRAAQADPLSVFEMQSVASVIEAQLPLIEAMEQRAIPPRLKVIAGGRG